MGHQNCAGRLVLLLAAGTLVLFDGLPASARHGSKLGEMCSAQGTTQEGEFVEGVEDWLTMTTDGQDRHRYVVAPETAVTLDGKAAALSDLKGGDRVLVTTKERHPTVALVVVAVRHGA
jgi:hypothetical protein